MNTVFSSAHSVSLAFRMEVKTLLDNRRFPEITGKDNLTVFSYSGRVKSPEWRRAAEKSRSATVLDLQAWTYYNLY